LFKLLRFRFGILKLKLRNPTQ